MSVAKLVQYSREFTPIPRLCKVTLIKSPIKQQQDVKEALRILKLRRPHDFMIHKNNTPIRGLIHQVRNLVQVEDVSPPAGVALDPQADVGPKLAAHLDPNRETEIKRLSMGVKDLLKPRTPADSTKAGPQLTSGGESTETKSPST